MAEAVFRVAEVGPVTTVQDGGRPGLMRFGVAHSGPMDRRSFAIAHAALGNAPGSAAIEVSVGGLTVECVAGAASVALAGGGFRAEADGRSTPSWAVRRLEKGSVLAVRPGPWGSWTYLAFAGELAADRWLGSAATHFLSGRGGGAVRPGWTFSVRAPRLLREGPIPFPATGRPRPQVRVVLGPQDRFFPPEAVAALLANPFALTTAYDRMGVRLAGPALTPAGPLTMPSEPLMRGSIQVAGDGVATVLLADHQTAGGYPKIATVVSEDLDGFAQLRSRQAVGFRAVSPEAAVGIVRTRHLAHARFLDAVARLAAERAAEIS